MDPVIVAAVVAGIVALVVGVVNVIPNVGNVRRLEQVVAIIEKIDPNDAYARESLIEVRDRLIQRLSIRAITAGPFLAAAAGFFTIFAVAALLYAGWFPTGSTHTGWLVLILALAEWVGLLGALIFEVLSFVVPAVSRRRLTAERKKRERRAIATLPPSTGVNSLRLSSSD